MVDTPRRKTQPVPGSSAAVLQAAAAARAQAYAQMNMNPAAFQAYQKQQHPSTPGRQARGTPRGQAKSPNRSKMGIKSGMTVEDLKRLTQQRMQQAGGAPKEPTAFPGRPSTPTLNMTAVNTSTPMTPKMGMSVQELKHLTALRVASQNAQAVQQPHTPQGGDTMNKAVLTNVAKSQYRESLRGTPNSTPRRSSGMPVSGVSAPMASSLPMRQMPQEPPGMHQTHAQMRSASQGMVHTSGMDFVSTAMNANRYGYGTMGDEQRSYQKSASRVSTETTPVYAASSHPMAVEMRTTEAQQAPSRQERPNAFQFPEDSFPPPPPMDDNGGFVATSLPSWSPPPARSKKLDTIAPPPVPFYTQGNYYSSTSKEDASKDQNAIIAPPPGLPRRPSMTVPWQVAEAVLNTPQTTSTRKQLLSPSRNSAPQEEPEVSNMFAVPSSALKPGIARNESTGMKSPAAEAAAQLGALTTQLARQRSGAAPGSGPTANALGTSPSASSTAPSSARRGSFGNAAEFFKFRRRSKSRLELARDLAGQGEAMFPMYGTPGTMPGIDERRADVHDNYCTIAHADTVSDLPASSSSDDDDDNSSVQELEDDELGRLATSMEQTNISADFVSFYNATSAGRSRQEAMGVTSLSIPPPPPPPMTDEEEDATSSNGLPMMSPNGMKLRKVAEMARRGSMSTEDKTRAKDEIIQLSLGIGASNAARTLSSKAPAPGSTPPQPAPMTMDRPPVSPPSVGPPPGFQRLSSTPPRDTPKQTQTKTIPEGIVRSTSNGHSARSPPKPLPQRSPSRQFQKSLADTSPQSAGSSQGRLEDRLAQAAQRVADCVSSGDMVGFQKAMEELDRLRSEASSMMRG